MKKLLASALLALVVLITGCSTTNPHRVVLNSADSTATAVNLAEKAWASYTVTTAKQELEAAGVTPTVAAITAKVNENPHIVEYVKLDADYRAAHAAFIQAYEAYQLAGANGVLDPAFRQKAVDAANALIDAVAQISGKPLIKAQ